MAANTIPIDRLRALIRLDQESGRLYWLVDKSQASRTGDEALTFTDSAGYRKGIIDGVCLKAHRVVYALSRGGWPSGEVDHRNGVRSDNRPGNLRDVDKSTNQRNASRRTDNKSGVAGVSWRRQSNAWMVRVRNKHIGLYDTFDAACTARLEAERQCGGFTARHGRNSAPTGPEREKSPRPRGRGDYVTGVYSGAMRQIRT
jgi:hypothetical protein